MTHVRPDDDTIRLQPVAIFGLDGDGRPEQDLYRGEGVHLRRDAVADMEDERVPEERRHPHLLQRAHLEHDGMLQVAGLLEGGCRRGAGEVHERSAHGRGELGDGLRRGA